ncbi:SGNH/GDSL hydrolase family protein [Streptacidiphilus carbonis]|jgi:lysophospholipase L1-like esterase|uniref:SGNH/GDSL hydrolase family protein n=1 Tax=Streptacidiphilus carbonis TaxID=105422 RepID=UPI0005A798B0|nr:SGNH/GDSL hydrolase family protein [Streptacidiphilus carbonis]
MLCRKARAAALLGCLLPALVATTAAAAASAAVRAPADGAVPRYREYVALGDSYQADSAILPGVTTDSVPAGCAQVSYDYPHQVAAALGVADFKDATCGGAVSGDMTGPQPVPLGANPPQFSRLSRDTDLVTVGIGGNDLDLIGLIGRCLALLPLPTTTCPHDPFTARIAAEQQVVGGVLAGIHQRAPHARVLLVNYLAVFPERGGCWPYVPIGDQDMPYLHRTLVAVDAMLGRAAAADPRGTELVDTYTPSIGHDVCQGPRVRWVEGLLPLSLNTPGVAVPFHPNRAGADAQARAVLARVGAGAPVR